jgi:hypothetical protein
MSPSNRVNRRGFLGQVGLPGAVLAAGVALPQSQASGEGASEGVFRAGCLNVSSYSHLENVWAPIINPREGQSEIAFTRMRITHCWEVDRDKAKAFAKTFGCEAVENFDDMLGKVDGIISGGYYNHPWNHILHEPYLEAGLPNLINRPFSNSLAKAEKMIETAKKHGATILVPSGHEHNDTIARAKAWAAGKKIVCYNATNSFDDYPTHGVHGIYLVCKAIAEAGNPVVSVGYQAESWHRPPGVVTLAHVDPEGRPFFGTLHQVNGSWATVTVHTAEEYGGRSFSVQTGTGFPFDKTEIWAPTLWAYEKMARFGEMPQTFDEIRHKNNAFLAGWRSILENEGKPVRLDEVPEDWESPVELPNKPGDETVSLFRKEVG